MKVIKVFIFCFIMFLVSTQAVLAVGSVEIILQLEIFGDENSHVLEENSFIKIINMITAGDFDISITEPIIIETIDNRGLSIVSTVSGSLDSNIVLSFF